MEIFESEEHVHLVFENLQKQDLFSFIKSKPKYTELDAREIMKSLLSVIGSFHSYQLIHRDIKPDNIYIS